MYSRVLLILKLSIRNLGRSPGRNLTMGLLVGLGVMLFLVGNSIIETSNAGLKASYSNNFTGDVVISQSVKEPANIYGSDLPGIDIFIQTSFIDQSEKIYQKVMATELIDQATFLLSSPIAMDIAGIRVGTIAFGVDGPQYFSMFQNFDIESGAMPLDSSDWAVLPGPIADQVEKTINRKLQPGEPVTFVFASGLTFAIRTVKLAAIIRHHIGNQALDRTVWVGAYTLRDLISGLNYTVSESDIPTTSKSFLDTTEDEMFSGDDFDKTDPAPVSGTETLESLLKSGTGFVDSQLRFRGLPSSPKDPWQFMLFTTKPGVAPEKAITRIQKELSESGMERLVGNWQTAAGSSASWITILSAIYNIGFLVLLGIIIFILANAFLISVMERTREIGSIRALGGNKAFVISLIGSETMILCLLGGTFGILSGSLLLHELNQIGIPLDNQLLSSMFGDSTLRPVLSVRGILDTCLLTLGIGVLSWIAPVQRALSMSPNQALSMEY